MSLVNETCFNNSSTTLLYLDEGIGSSTPPTTVKPSSITHHSNSKSKTTTTRRGSTGHESASGHDASNNSRKVPSLIPPQRLAIPQKYLNSNGSFAVGKSGLVLEVDAANSVISSSSKYRNENKPLVQWDSDESEEELSFFPKPKKKSALSDNLSVENMNLSGDDDDEDDLHLTPPKDKSMISSCPCDPRLWGDSKWFKPNNGSFSMSKSTSSTFSRRRLDNRSCSIT